MFLFELFVTSDFLSESLVLLNSDIISTFSDYWFEYAIHSFITIQFWIIFLSIIFSFILFGKNKILLNHIKTTFSPLLNLFEKNYFFDNFFISFLAIKSTNKFGKLLNENIDISFIDNFFVNGTAKLISKVSNVVRQIQSGYIYQYALFMLVGLFAFILFRVFKMIHELPILSILIWLPILVGFVSLLVGAENNKKQYFLISISNITFFLCSILLFFIFLSFDATDISFQFIENYSWIQSPDINYKIGIDSISLLLLILNTIIFLLISIHAYGVVTEKMSQYLGAFLILCGVINGVFCALDLLLFYIFFEVTLIPMFILIGIWGGPNKIYASTKFFLYTLFGSLLALLAIIYIYYETGTFDLVDLRQQSFPNGVENILFFAFFCAFAVKIPMWPIHTWLPDAHTEAPTAGSVVLAAVLLKLGGYGFLRVSLPILPDASLFFSPLIVFLSLIAIIYIGLVALVQKDMKRLIAYSSIAHMGFVTLGLFLFDDIAILGSIYQLLSHGFISAALFFCIGVLYDRFHSRNIIDYGGLASKMPIFASFFLFFGMSNAGLPGTSGFVGEFFVIIAAIKFNLWIGILAATTLIFGAAYTLWMYKRVMFGELNAQFNSSLKIKDVYFYEIIIFSILTFIILVMGIKPNFITTLLEGSIYQITSVYSSY